MDDVFHELNEALDTDQITTDWYSVMGYWLLVVDLDRNSSSSTFELDEENLSTSSMSVAKL